jgi:hypothetical protein
MKRAKGLAEPATSREQMNASKGRSEILASLPFYADLLQRILDLPMAWRATKSESNEGEGGINL